MHAIRIHQTGGPEVLTYEEVAVPTPGAGEVLVKIAATGVNFIDVYHRIGLYPQPLPLTLGLEAAGTIEAVGPDAGKFKVGDKVAWASCLGSYAEYAVVPVAKIVPVPAGVDLQVAAAVMLQGMTAHYLAYSTYPVQRGDRVLIHAAAGGVGLLLSQLTKSLGATVYGTVSTEEKAALAREAGCDEVILYTQSDFEAEIKRLTNGEGVHVVYDSVGKTTFDKSLSCLRLRGYMVLFGQSSGSVPPFDPAILNAKGSVFLTRPSLFHYVAQRSELLDRASDLFGWIDNGELKVRFENTFPLSDAAEAHRQLEARATTGKVLLIP